MKHSLKKWMSAPHLFFATSFLCLMLCLFSFCAEYIFGIIGCRLCHIERGLFFIGGVISFFGIFLYKHHKNWSYRLWYWGMVLFWILCFAVCAYHVGLQYHLFHVPQFCSVQISQSIEEFMKHQPISCDQKSLVIFSLPAPVYLSIISLILLALWTRKRP